MGGLLWSFWVTSLEGMSVFRGWGIRCRFLSVHIHFLSFFLPPGTFRYLTRFLPPVTQAKKGHIAHQWPSSSTVRWDVRTVADIVPAVLRIWKYNYANFRTLGRAQTKASMNPCAAEINIMSSELWFCCGLNNKSPEGLDGGISDGHKYSWSGGSCLTTDWPSPVQWVLQTGPEEG